LRLGDVASAAMTAPNLIALIGLSGVIFKLTKDYEAADKTRVKTETPSAPD